MTVEIGTMGEASGLLANWQTEGDEASFWSTDGKPQPDYALLARLLGISVGNRDTTRSGLFAKCLDLWTSWELRQAGFAEDAVWPRMEEPRAIDPEVLRASSSLPGRLQEAGDRLVANAGKSDVSVMGSVYEKQVDVGMASWPSGPELLVSTKTMGGSFGKNTANRFEEAYGDAKNLRERHPMAAHGFLYLVRSTVVAEGGAYQKIVHMLRSLARPGDIYDAVGLIVVEWGEGDASSVVVPSSEEAGVPEELSVEHFFGTMVDIVLANSPLSRHIAAREMREVYSPDG